MDARKQTPLMQRFYRLMGEGLDISEHLGLLRGLACDNSVHSIAEIGFRTGVSATALCTSGKPVHAIDISKCQPHVDKLKAIAPSFMFSQRSSLEGEPVSSDFLHIDGLHTGKQLLAELNLWAPVTWRYIAMHDTETFGTTGQDKQRPGLKDALSDFRLTPEGKRWNLLLHLCNNNGFTVLERCAR